LQSEWLWCGNVSSIVSREGLRPRALANLEGDSIQWELSFLVVGRDVAHRRAQCNAPMGGVWPDVSEGVRLLGKSTGSYGKPETTRGFVSPKVDVQAWLVSNTTVQEDLL